MKTPSVVLPFLLLLTATAAAQVLDGAAAQEPQQPLARQRLQKALATMASLPSVAFRTEEQRDLAALRNQGVFGGGWVVNFGDGPSADGVAGVWIDGLLCGRHGDDEWILAGGRSIARSKADPTWRLRDRRLADGRRAPRLVDPQALVLALLDSDLEVTGTEVGSRDDRPVERITATLSGDAVAELMWAGLLPANGSSEVLALGGGQAVPSKPEAVLDLCFVIDPATGVLHEIRTASYADSGVVGGAVAFGPAGGVAVALEDVTEAAAEPEAAQQAGEAPVVAEREAAPATEQPATQEPAIEQPESRQPARVQAAAQVVVRLAGPASPAAAAGPDRQTAGHLPEGLPARDRAGMDVLSFVVHFAKPGAAELPELDARALRLLGRRDPSARK